MESVLSKELMCSPFKKNMFLAVLLSVVVVLG